MPEQQKVHDADVPKRSGQKTDSNARQSPERDQVNQDPGHRQKQNQSDKKDDPLAA